MIIITFFFDNYHFFLGSDTNFEVIIFLENYHFLGRSDNFLRGKNLVQLSRDEVRVCKSGRKKDAKTTKGKNEQATGAAIH